MSAFVTIRGLRDHFGASIGRDRLSRLMNAGHIRCVVVNGRRVVSWEEVRRFERLLASPQPVTLRDTDGTVLLSKAGLITGGTNAND